MAIFEENEKEFNASMGENIQVTPLDVTELEDIRTGYDGSKYASAGLAVRSQVDKLHQRVDGQQEQIDGIYETFKGIVDDDVIAGDTAWSSKRIVETVCPTFSESGALVSCTPLFGSIVEVITRFPETENGITSLSLHHTGKNLWDFKSGMDVCRGISGGTGGDILRYGYIVELPPGTYTISAEVVTAGDYIYFNPINLDTLVMGALTYFHTGQSTVAPVRVTLNERQGLYFYDAGRLNTTNAGHRALAEKAFYENLNIQIEAGTVATPYEQYWGYWAGVNFGTPIYGGSFNWITGLLTEDNGQEHQFSPRYLLRWRPGTTYLYSSAGLTEVSGWSDPNAIIEKLTNAIISLGGNV